MVKLTAALLSAVMLGACTASMVAPIRKDVGATQEQATKQLEQIRRPPAQPRPTAAERDSGIWLPVHKVRDIEVHPHNELGNREIAVNREFQTIQEVAERIALLTGIPVIISPDAAVPQIPGNALGRVPAQAAPQPLVPPIAGVPQPPLVASAAASAATVSLSYSGPLSGFLDVVAARYGVSWEWQANRIRFYRYVTKTFNLVALPGDMTLQNTISNTSGGGSGGSAGASTNSSATSSTNQTGVSFSGLSIWKAVEDSIKSMLSPAGKTTVTPATGTVTVTDTPQVVAQVERFIEEQNTALGQQVIVNVQVLAVDLTNTDQYGINWNVVYNALSQNFGWTFSNAFRTDPSAANLTLKILGTAGAATNSDIKAWQGSQALIAALSTQGHVSQITSASVTTLNNQAAPFQVGRQNSYLASSTTTVTQGAGATTTLQPGLITTGFSLNVVPHVLDRGRLLLQYAINLSSLINIATVSSNGSSIQTPEIDTRDFMQRVMLNSGDNLVMTGFEQTALNAKTQGPGSPDNVLLGGGVNGSRSRSILVILIQPFIAENR